MAKQHGINPFTGKLGEVVGRKLNGEFITQRPGGFTSEALKAGKETNYKKTYENANEFSLCSRMASAIYGTVDRIEFKANIHGDAYKKMAGDLRRFCKYDKINPKGKRRPNETALMQLVNYSFNPSAKNTLKEKPQIAEDDETNLTVTLNKGARQFAWPKNAAAIQLFFYTARINFKKQKVRKAAFHYQELLKEEIAANHQIRIPTPPGNCLLLIGARFLEEVNNDFYVLYEKTRSPLFVGYYRKNASLK